MGDRIHTNTVIITKLFVAILICLPLFLLGQVDSTKLVKNTVDTTPILKYYHLNSETDTLTITDSLTSMKMVKYGSRNVDFGHYIHTGIDGSAGTDLLYNPLIEKGLAIGYNQYNLYNYNLNNFNFYSYRNAITLFNFSMLGNLKNFHLGASYYSPLKNNLSFSLQFNRYNNIGFYSNQATLCTNFATALKYDPEKKKYSATLGYLRNSNVEQNNGGLPETTNYNTTYKDGLPTFLQSDSTRQNNDSYFFIHKLKLFKTSSSGSGAGFRHQIEYNKRYIKFVDHGVSDSISLNYYGALVSDTRGLRKLVSLSTFANYFWAFGRFKNIEGEAGIYYGITSLKDHNFTENRHDISLLFNGNIPIGKVFDIKAIGSLGIGGNAGNFDVKGSIGLNLSKVLKLDAFFRLFRTEPTYQEKQLIVNDVPIFVNDFQKPFGSILFGQLNIPKIHLGVAVTQTLVNNPIYRSDLFVPTQLSGIYSNTHLTVQHDLKVWKFHFENTIDYQLVSHRIYPIPTLLSNHLLYYQGIWFRKALEVRLGGGMRYLYDMPAFTYHPGYAEFVPVQTSATHQFPNVQMFLAAKATTFWFKFSFENFLGYFNDVPDFQLVNYPVLDQKLRFSIIWHLPN